MDTVNCRVASNLPMNTWLRLTWELRKNNTHFHHLLRRESMLAHPGCCSLLPKEKSTNSYVKARIAARVCIYRLYFCSHFPQTKMGNSQDINHLRNAFESAQTPALTDVHWKQPSMRVERPRPYRFITNFESAAARSQLTARCFMLGHFACDSDCFVNEKQDNNSCGNFSEEIQSLLVATICRGTIGFLKSFLGLYRICNC